MAQLLPKFEAERLTEPVMRTVYSVKEGGGFETKQVMGEPGTMIYFPKGHSIRIRQDKELRRLGFHRSAPLVDTRTGEEVAPSGRSLRDVVSTKTRSTRSNRKGPSAEDPNEDGNFNDDA